MPGDGRQPQHGCTALEGHCFGPHVGEVAGQPGRGAWTQAGPKQSLGAKPTTKGACAGEFVRVACSLPATHLARSCTGRCGQAAACLLQVLVVARRWAIILLYEADADAVCCVMWFGPVAARVAVHDELQQLHMHTHECTPLWPSSPCPAHFNLLTDGGRVPHASYPAGA